MAKKKYFVDLFAGCGGLSLGLEEAGFTPILFSELNKSAAATYLANRSKLSVVAVNDIRTLTAAKLQGLAAKWRVDGVKDIDLVCGGPPCQGYSGIGHRRSFKVEKNQVPSNHLYMDMIRVIRTLRPKLFLFENVRGLLSGRWSEEGRPGEIWRDVVNAFSSIESYDVVQTLVHAKDYGVPQNRPRVLIAGIRRDLGFRAQLGRVADGLLPEGHGNAPHLEELLGDLEDPDFISKFSTEKYPLPAQKAVQREMRRDPETGAVFKKGDRVLEHEYSQHSERVREKFSYMLKHDGVIPDEMRTKKFAQRVLPARWGTEGPTITATSLADDFVHYSQPRVLTVREWARLQTFPDWYVFKGPRTTGGRRRAGNPDEGNWDREVPRYTQIGNAVPVQLGRAFGQHFRQYVD